MRRYLFLAVFLAFSLTSAVYCHGENANTAADGPVTKISPGNIPAIYIGEIDLDGISITTSDVLEDEDEISDIRRDIARRTRKIFTEKLNDVSFIVKKRPEDGYILSIKLSGRYNESGLLENLIDSEPRAVTLFMNIKLTSTSTGETILSAEDERSRVIQNKAELMDRGTQDKQLNAWYDMIRYWATMLANDLRTGKHM